MTREEQIDWLCRLRAYLNNGIIFTPWNKEFTEALNKALEHTKNEEPAYWYKKEYTRDGYIVQIVISLGVLIRVRHHTVLAAVKR